jgi:hypothetical protein
VRVGTVFEASHVPLRYWLQAMAFMTASKKGISSNQLHRTLGVTLKTAWFMSHRIREAMRVVGVEPMGGAGKTVEIDETVFGKQEGAPMDASFKGSNFRNVVLTLVERGGSARSFHVEGSTIGTLMPILRANIAKETAIMPTKLPGTTMSKKKASRAMRPLLIARANMSGMRPVALSIPIPLRAIIRFSSVA